MSGHQTVMKSDTFILRWRLQFLEVVMGNQRDGGVVAPSGEEVRIKADVGAFNNRHELRLNRHNRPTPFRLFKVWRQYLGRMIRAAGGGRGLGTHIHQVRITLYCLCAQRNQKLFPHQYCNRHTLYNPASKFEDPRCQYLESVSKEVTMHQW
jgi:hypothetical protein